MFIPLPKPLNQNKYFIGTYGDPFPANKLYRRENLVQYRIFFDVNSNGVADDNLFNLEYFGHVKTIKYVDSRGWHHRMVENSITHSFKKDRDIQEQYYLRSVKKYCDSHSEINEILDLLFCFNAFFVWFGYVCRVFMNDNMNIKEKKMLIKDFRRIDEIAEMFKTIQWRKFPKVTQILVFFVGKYEMYCLLYIAVKVYFKRHI